MSGRGTYRFGTSGSFLVGSSPTNGRKLQAVKVFPGVMFSFAFPHPAGFLNRKQQELLLYVTDKQPQSSSYLV